MSTYEALVDMHVRFDQEFKKLCLDADDLVRISRSILGLIEDGVVDLGGPYLPRIELLSRRIAVARRLGGDSFDEVDKMLRNVDILRLRLDVAFDLKSDHLVKENENLIAKTLDLAHLELEGAFTLMEHLKTAMREMAPPRLVVG